MTSPSWHPWSRLPGGLAVALALGLGACAQGPIAVTGAPSGALFDDARFAPPTQRIDATDIFAVSPAMQAYLDSRVAEAMKGQGATRGLVDALFTSGRLRLAYDADYTRNAAEAFDAGAGNCLSLAILTGSMARAAGLSVRYQAVRTSEHWERDGDLLELVGHVNVSVGVPLNRFRAWSPFEDRWTIDFLPPSELGTQVAVPITEARVAAMYMNNRAAEALAQQRVDDAYWWARGGLAQDPTLFSLYNTLGLAWLRKGEPARAEAALRQAIALEPQSAETWSNLAVVMRREGRAEEAAQVERQHPRSRAATLASAIAEGLRANEAGDYAHARDVFERALRLAGGNHELHYLLAVAYLNLGDRERAMAQLHEAESDSPSARLRSLYASKVELLKSTTSRLRLDPGLARSN